MKAKKMNMFTRILTVFIVAAAALTATIVFSGLDDGTDGMISPAQKTVSVTDVVVSASDTTTQTASQTTAPTTQSTAAAQAASPKKTTKKTAKKTTKKTQAAAPAAPTPAPTAAPQTTPAPPTTTTTRIKVTTTTTMSNAQRESAMFNNINSYRQSHGASSLSRVTSGPLYNAARKRLSEICTSFSHTRPNGSNFNTVFAECGISYSHAGENLGCGSLDGVYSSWINSSSHRSNIMGGYSRSALVSTVSGGRRYWVQLFIG